MSEAQAGPKPQDYSNRQSWKARPKLAKILRITLFTVPIVAAIGATMLLGRALYRPQWAVSVRVGWMVAMFVVASQVSSRLSRLMNRFLPLQALCQLNLRFPKEAPSRMKMALRLGNTAHREKVLADFHKQGLSHDPQTSALEVLELIQVLNEHDRKTRGHSEKVRALTDVIAVEMGLSDDDRNRLRWASMLHDMGKISVPAEILNKAGKPTPEEWEILKAHPAAGESKVQALRPWLGDAINCVWEHHERYDGSGYPNRLSGGQINQFSSIVAVADAFEVMTAARSYKKPMTYDDARAELVRCSGTHFNPVVVRAMLQVGRRRTQVATGLFSSWVSNFAADSGRLGSFVRTVSQGASSGGGALPAIVAPVVKVVQMASAPQFEYGSSLASAFGNAPVTTLAKAAAKTVATVVTTTTLLLAPTSTIPPSSPSSPGTSIRPSTTTTAAAPAVLALVEELASTNVVPEPFLALSTAPITTLPVPAQRSPAQPVPSQPVPSQPIATLRVPALPIATQPSTTLIAVAETTTTAEPPATIEQSDITSSIPTETTTVQPVSVTATIAASPAATTTTTTTTLPTTTTSTTTTSTTTTTTSTTTLPTTTTTSTTTTTTQPPIGNSATTAVSEVDLMAAGIAADGISGVALGADGSWYFAAGSQLWKRTVTGVYEVIAGTGTAGYSGDGGLAAAAKLKGVGPLVRLSDGTIYFSDSSNNRVRMIDPSGIISTVAGTGVAGFSGDGGLATSAQFAFPRGLALQNGTTLLIADAFNGRLRSLDLSTGIVTTVAGGGLATPVSGVTATAAVFTELLDVDVAANGDPIFVDKTGGSVWKVESGQLLLALSGLNSPRRITKTPDGSFLVVERGGRRVWRIPLSGFPSVVAGTGNAAVTSPGPDGTPATAVDLFAPWEVWADALGFWISENAGKSVRRILW